ncbi:MAG TPA: hypothetical protein VGI86_20445 [Acidimicrobiia bacterium]|jgi:hypothetical protein
MTTLLPAVLTIALFVAIVAFATTGRFVLTPFSGRRARMDVRSATGSNVLTMLAAVNVATLATDVLTHGAQLHVPSGPLSVGVPILVVIVVTLLVFSPRVADVLMGLIGVAAAVADAAIDHGAPGVALVLVVALSALWLVGLLRGFFAIR